MKRSPFRATGDNDVERIVREAAWIRSFCVEVCDVFRRGEFLRDQTGLTQRDVAYAAAVGEWAQHRADLARWYQDPENRAADVAARAGSANENAQRRVASMPKVPGRPRPQTLQRPPHWPEDPTSPTWGEALATFLAARRGAAARR